jgi:hypothetical protein
MMKRIHRDGTSSFEESYFDRHLQTFVGAVPLLPPSPPRKSIRTRFFAWFRWLR